ncbi:nitroreductase/quinone reductase family protein [Propionibacteriaceae bacterium Y2011]
MAMNGWGEAHPAWWLNLQANPDATVVLPGGEERAVRATEATGNERDRLWATFRTLEDDGTDLDALAALRSRRTPVVVLAPTVA